MKVALIFSDMLVRTRPFDFASLWTDARGLTGSEMCFVRCAQEMAKQGHDVSIFTVHVPNKLSIWDDIKLYNIEEINNIDETFDAAISWCDPDKFRTIPKSIVRLCNQQLNYFGYCKADYDDFVDIWSSPSKSHMDIHAKLTPIESKWCVIYNGCDPDVYLLDDKEEGRIIYTSSPDRGLHWLLQEWGYIKSKAPKANLRVFYYFAESDVETFEKPYSYKINEPMLFELGQRMRYIKNSLKKLEKLDVKYCGSTNRIGMIQELNKSMVLGYPTSPVNAYTEGFSVSTMEACAAGCIPVICDTDAMGELYGEVSPMIQKPVETNSRIFADLVVKSITDEDWRKEASIKCHELSKKYSWLASTKQHIDAIQNHPKYKEKNK